MPRPRWAGRTATSVIQPNVALSPVIEPAEGHADDLIVMGCQEGERWIKAFQSNIPAAPFLKGEVIVEVCIGREGFSAGLISCSLVLAGNEGANNDPLRPYQGGERVAQVDLHMPEVALRREAPAGEQVVSHPVDIFDRRTGARRAFPRAVWR